MPREPWFRAPKSRLSMKAQDSGRRWHPKRWNVHLHSVASRDLLLEVEFAGFQKTRRTGIVVNIQQQSVIDVSLTPGEVTQTVEVEASAPLLQTAERLGRRDSRIRRKSTTCRSAAATTTSWRASPRASLTPSRRAAASPQPDGLPPTARGRPRTTTCSTASTTTRNNVDFLSGAAYVVKPPVDAIGEIKLLTNSFSAEYGRAGGAVLNATLKSGTNAVPRQRLGVPPQRRLNAADFFQHTRGGGKGAYDRTSSASPAAARS